MKEKLIKLIKSGDIDGANEILKGSSDIINFSETDLSGFDLSGLELVNIDFTGCDFSESTINCSNFSESDLSTANFSRSEILTTNFSNTVLNGTIFIGAKLNNCNFNDADLSGADFSEADLSDSDFSVAQNLSMCIFDNYTIWPDDENLPEEFDSSYHADLSSLSDGDDFPDADFAY